MALGGERIFISFFFFVVVIFLPCSSTCTRRFDMVIVIVKGSHIRDTRLYSAGHARVWTPVRPESAVLGHKLQGLTFPGSQMDPQKYENEIPSRLSIYCLRLIFEPQDFVVLLSHLLTAFP